MGLLDLKVCSSSILGCFFSKQKLDGIGFLVAVCVPCYWQPHLLFRQSFIMPACWRPSPPTPLTKGVTLTPTGLTCELKDVDTTGRPVHRRGMSAGPPSVSKPISFSATENMWQNPLTLSMGLQVLLLADENAGWWIIGKWRKERKKVKLLSHVRLFATTWTIAH